MRKIFLVEDDPAISEVLEMLLSSENYDVQCFATVRALKERDSYIQPDLYIFDVMLPDGSGTDLCLTIKKNNLSKDVPVILMSAHALLKDICDRCQPDDFVPKPFDIDQLLVKVRQIIKH